MAIVGSVGSAPAHVSTGLLGFTDRHNKAGEKEGLSSKPADQSIDDPSGCNKILFLERMGAFLLSAADNKIASFTEPNFHRFHLNFRVPQIHPTRIALPRFCFGPSNKPWFQKALIAPFKTIRLVFDWRAKSNAFWFSRNTYLALQKTLEAGEALSYRDAKEEVDRIVSFTEDKIIELEEMYSRKSENTFMQKCKVFCNLHNPWGEYASRKRLVHLSRSVLKELWGKRPDNDNDKRTLTEVKRDYWVGRVQSLSMSINSLGGQNFGPLKQLGCLFLKCTAGYWLVKFTKVLLSYYVNKLEQRIQKHKIPSTYALDSVKLDGIKNHRRTLAHQAELLEKICFPAELDVVDEVHNRYKSHIDALKIDFLKSKIKRLQNFSEFFVPKSAGSRKPSCDGESDLMTKLRGWVAGKIKERCSALQSQINRIGRGPGENPGVNDGNRPRTVADFYYDAFFNSIEDYAKSFSDSSSNGATTSSCNSTGSVVLETDSDSKAKLKQISALILASLEGKSLRRNMREWVCILKEASKQGLGLDAADMQAIRDLHNKLVNKHAYDITKISQVFFHCGYGLRAQNKQRMYTDAIPEIVRLMRLIEGKNQSISSGLMRYNLDVPNLLLKLLNISGSDLEGQELEEEVKRLQTPQGKAFFLLMAKEVSKGGGIFNDDFHSLLKRFSKGTATPEDLRSIVSCLGGSFSNQNDGIKKIKGQDFIKKLALENKDIFFETSAIDFFQNESFNWSKLLTKNENRRYKNAEFMSKVLGLDLDSTMANYRRAQYAILKHGNSWIQTSAKTSSNVGMACALVSNPFPYMVMLVNKPLGVTLMNYFLPMIADMGAYVGGAIAGLFDPILPLVAVVAKYKRIQELPKESVETNIHTQYSVYEKNSSMVTQEQSTTQPVVRSFWEEFKQCHGAAHKASFKTIYQGAAETIQWAYSVASRSLVEKFSGKDEALAFEDHATNYLSKVHNKLLKGRFLFAAKSEAELDNEVVESIKVMAYSITKVVVVGGGGTLAAVLGLVAWMGKLLGSAIMKIWPPKLPNSDDTVSDRSVVNLPELSNLESLEFADFKRNLILIIKDIFDNPFGLIKYLPNIAANILAFSVALLDFLFDKMARINPPDEASVKALAAVDNSSSPSSSSAEVGSSSTAGGTTVSSKYGRLTKSDSIVIGTRFSGASI